MPRRKRYTPYKKVKVIYRKDSDGNILAFFPELSANYGNIVCYQHIGQHGEASTNYYTNNTEKATPNEYKELHKELKSIYHDAELSVKQRLYYSDLTEKAWRIKEEK